MLNVFRICLGIAVAALSAAAWPQAFPSRPIRIVVGFPPGGGVDVLARSLAPSMSASLGQQIVVDNRAGAGGTLASDIVARATPDGHTILIVSASHAVSASVYKHLTYDAVKDFSAVSLIALSPNVLLANPEFGASSLGEIIKAARASPGRINYATGGTGTTGHLSAELLLMQTGLQMNHIPYKGNPLALADLIAGRVQLMFTTVPTALPQIKAGRVKAVAVTTLKRFVVLPDVPTVAESGVPGYEAANWFGVLAPRGTPAAVVARLHSELVKSLANRDVAEAILRQGAEPTGSSASEFAQYLSAEVVKWAKIVRKAGINP